MSASDITQMVLSVLTVVGSMFAVRYEMRSRVDSLNKEVVALQDRKIALLTEQLNSEREMRKKMEDQLGELKQTVQEQALMIARLERERRSEHQHAEGSDRL